MKRKFILSFSIFLTLVSSVVSVAQQTSIYTDAEKKYRLALELFDKQKYGAAQKEFDEVVVSKDVSSEARINSLYLGALCAVELFNKDAEFRLLLFLKNHPESLHLEEAKFELGKLHYRQKHWKKSIEWLEGIDASALSQNDKDEYYFKLGYAYYMSNDFERSVKVFFVVKDGDSKYASAAQYYYAHMMYVSKNYETALKSFQKLEQSGAFAPVAPYYITQIYYLQGKYNEVLKYAPPFMDSSGTKSAMEIGRMIGESYYHKEEYKEAIVYINDYVKNSGAGTRSDYYQLGYCYYRIGDCDKAFPHLKRVTDVDDSLAQYAYYNLADCFLKTNNKQSARNAFQSAGKMKYDETIREESLFNFAKLSYELNFQSVAITAFKDYFISFPQGRYKDDCNEMLVAMYSSTKNYKDALASIENLKSKSERIKTIYQRVAYYRGIELFMDNRNKEAIEMFDVVQTNNYDRSISAEALYWKGEAQYRLKDYDDAISSYNGFLFSPADLKQKQYNLANYNIGYCFFKKEDYTNSQSWFRKYIVSSRESGTDSKGKISSVTPNSQHLTPSDRHRYNDALLRIADSFFMLKDQANAMDYYAQAIENKAQSSDYALYQKALILGIQNKMNDKIMALQRIFNSFPKSVYFDDALYEAANASLLIGNNDQALKWYKSIITDYPKSSYVKMAMLGKGLVQYNSKKDEEAIATYKDLISKYPNTPESKEALAQLKMIAVSKNQVDDYLTYIKSIPNADVSMAAQDSLVYETAESRYTQGDCDNAVKDMGNYLNKFPDGAFRNNANYYRADCQFRNKRFESALIGYNYIIAQPKNSFTEKSLLNAASINYLLKQYEIALRLFEELESLAEVKHNIIAAQSGQMRCAFYLKQYEKSILNADKLVNSDNANKDLQNEAHLIKGRSSLALNDLVTSKLEFTIVSKRTNSEMTAEANYYLALIEYMLGNYKECKNLVFNIQKQVPSYDYWIAKAFVLLGDNYIAQKDSFQAKETYRSIIENYQKDPSDPDDLKEIARQKLNSIVASETKESDLMDNKIKQDFLKDPIEVK